MSETIPFEGEGTQFVVLRAAMARFSAYGFKKTSMEDIANEAMVSRPTLYSYFKNKQAILRAVSEGINDAVLANIAAALQADAPLEDRLIRAFRAWTAPFISILFGSQHGAELIGAGSAIAADISVNAREHFHRLLTKALRKAKRSEEIDLLSVGMSLEGAADFLILSLNGLSTGESDAATQDQRVESLAKVFLSAVAK